MTQTFGTAQTTRDFVENVMPQRQALKGGREKHGENNKMKKYLALLMLVLLPLLAFAADSSYYRYNADTDLFNKIKLIDNGDGTFSEQVGTTSSIGGTFTLQAKEAYSAPDSLTLIGTGVVWAFEVRNGSATFTVAGSSQTTLIASSGGSASLNGRFEPAVTNPTLALIYLQAGATAQLILSGGQ